MVFERNLGDRVLIKNIDYGNRPSDGHSTHRLKDEDETYEYICWDGELIISRTQSKLRLFGRIAHLDILEDYEVSTHMFRGSPEVNVGISNTQINTEDKNMFLKKIKEGLKPTPDTLKDLQKSLAYQTPEQLAMLGSSDGKEVDVTFYISKSKSTQISCEPDVEICNKVIQEWHRKGIEFCGFAHSHPGAYSRLSVSDIEYGGKIMDALDMDSIELPIVILDPRLDGGCTVFWYTLYHDRSFTGNPREVYTLPGDQPEMPENFHSRISKTLPIEILKDSTIIQIGCGGSVGATEALARCGIGRFILIDPDICNPHNILTQRSYLAESGQAKVKALANKILNVNPKAKVDIYWKAITDDTTIEEFTNMLPKDTLEDFGKVLVVASTDNFHAQDAILNIALKLGVPFMAPQMYEGGLASEIVFYYPGVTKTWDKVQNILASRINGERTVKHPHFLKSSVYCAECGSRLMVSNEKKKNGDVYPYFVCAGRHSKRVKDCTMKAVLIDVVEKKIEQIYDNYQLPPEIRQDLEEYLRVIILKEREKFNSELDGLNRTKISLEHKRQKLLEAHYSDAIPLDLMKSEQKKIAKELAGVEHEINMHNVTFENILANLHLALDLIEDCGTTYRAADDMTKRLINQALISRFLVSNGNDGLNINVEFKAPFDTILEPIKDTVAHV